MYTTTICKIKTNAFQRNQDSKSISKKKARELHQSKRDKMYQTKISNKKKKKIVKGFYTEVSSYCLRAYRRAHTPIDILRAHSKQPARRRIFYKYNSFFLSGV